MKSEAQKPLVILAVLIVVFTIGILIVKPQRAGVLNQSQLVDTAVSDQIVSDETALWSIDVKYPQFVGVSSEFNDSIKKFATAGIEEFKTNAQADYDVRLKFAVTPEEMEEVRNNPWKYYYGSSYTIIQNTDRHISVLMHQSGFSGGAHGYDVIGTFNYDRQAAKALTLADMFPNDSNYLESLSKIARGQLQAKLGEYYAADMAEPGTEPTAENFSWFTFTDDKLTLYFQQYQVGPYAVGQQTVEIER